MWGKRPTHHPYMLYVSNSPPNRTCDFHRIRLSVFLAGESPQAHKAFH